MLFSERHEEARMAAQKNVKVPSDTDIMQSVWGHGRTMVRAVYEAFRAECCVAQPTSHERQRTLAVLAWGLRAH
jgi:hypothetical protein